MSGGLLGATPRVFCEAASLWKESDEESGCGGYGPASRIGVGWTLLGVQGGGRSGYGGSLPIGEEDIYRLGQPDSHRLVLAFRIDKRVEGRGTLGEITETRRSKLRRNLNGGS